MSAQQNLRLVQEFYAAFQRGDVTGALNTLADNVGWFIPARKTSFRLRESAEGASRSPSSSQNLRTCRMRSCLISENS